MTGHAFRRMCVRSAPYGLYTVRSVGSDRLVVAGEGKSGGTGGAIGDERAFNPCLTTGSDILDIEAHTMGSRIAEVLADEQCSGFAGRHRLYFMMTAVEECGGGFVHTYGVARTA